MSAQPQSTSNISELPKVLREATPTAKPQMEIIQRPPEASQLVKAILDARVELKCAYLEDLVRPETWAVIKALGEPDPDGNPHVQAINAMHLFMALNYERRVYGNEDTAILKYEGWASANFDHFSHAAGVAVQP